MGYNKKYFTLVQLGARKVKGGRKKIIYKTTKFGPRKKEKRFEITKLKLK